MGLFDKLKNASSGGGDPLRDEIVKKYYDTIFDMRMSLGWYGKESADINSRGKKYIELVHGEKCDEGRFIKAVELFNLSNTDYPKTKLEIRMVDYRKSLYAEFKARGRQSSYALDKKTIYEACYSDFLDEVKTAYEAILNVIGDDVTCKHFGEGLNKLIFDKYRETYDSEIIKCCINIAVVDKFFEGNETTCALLFELLVDMLHNVIYSPRPYSPPYVYTLHLFALSAVNFEKNGSSKNDYKPIADSDYFDFVAGANVYADKIKEHLFDKEAYIQEVADKIKESVVFSSENSSYHDKGSGPCVCWVDSHDKYFVDALCNYAWKEMRKEFEGYTNDNGDDLGASMNPEDITTVVYNFIKD